MIEMAKLNKDMLMFFLPIILFSPSDSNDFPSQQNMIIEYQLRYTKQLEKIIRFHGNGDENFGVVNFATANDLILRVREV